MGQERRAVRGAAVPRQDSSGFVPGIIPYVLDPPAIAHHVRGSRACVLLVVVVVVDATFAHGCWLAMQGEGGRGCASRWSRRSWTSTYAPSPTCPTTTCPPGSLPPPPARGRVAAEPYFVTRILLYSIYIYIYIYIFKYAVGWCGGPRWWLLGGGRYESHGLLRVREEMDMLLATLAPLSLVDFGSLPSPPPPWQRLTQELPRESFSTYRLFSRSVRWDACVACVVCACMVHGWWWWSPRHLPEGHRL
jgi:hypothetical protein